MDHLRDLFPRIVEVPFGLFTDIDGTISEIVAVPQEATVTPGCRSALKALAHKLALVAVVTGRDVETARRMMQADGLVYVGNHGLERWQGGELQVASEAHQYRERITEAARQLRERLTLPGIFVEEKGLGLSVHYRGTRNWVSAHSTILSTLQELGVGEWLDIQPGKADLNLRLAIGVNKGTAIYALAREFHLRGAIVLGDDITDVDGFRALRRLAEEEDFLGVSVAVVEKETPEEVAREATYHLQGVRAVEQFLIRLRDFLDGGEDSTPGRGYPETGTGSS